MIIFGALRVKNEARWISSVIASIQPVCERIFVFDDNSTDGTPEFCERNEQCTVIRSPFTDIHEARDKDFLLERIMNSISDVHLRGNPRSPFWVLMIDGDEILAEGDADRIRESIASEEAYAYALRILYVWDQHNLVRVDGVYRHFARPSVFRLMNSAFRFQRTPNGGNFHCSSIPQELLYGHKPCGARLLHYGYFDADLRRRKYDFYNRVDPNNAVEDCYRHVIQGDVDGPHPAAKLVHAGPLEFAPLA